MKRFEVEVIKGGPKGICSTGEAIEIFTFFLLYLKIEALMSLSCFSPPFLLESLP
jgi:hypothetical protein